MIAFRVGHGAYSGANVLAVHDSYKQALRDLLSRGVPMFRAHRALQSALAGSHATASTRRGLNVVEVVAFV